MFHVYPLELDVVTASSWDEHSHKNSHWAALLITGINLTIIYDQPFFAAAIAALLLYIGKYFYQQHMQRKMQDEVRNILCEYLPLGELIRKYSEKNILKKIISYKERMRHDISNFFCWRISVPR